MLRLNQPFKAQFASAYAQKSFAHKAEQFCFYFRSLKASAANIFKQEALAAGAELVVCSGAIVGESGQAMLIANRQECERIAYKLSLQPFGLAQIAKKLRAQLAATAAQKIELMQIININEDSFYKNSAQSWQKELINCDVQFADIGASSSAPGRKYIGEDAELAALSEVFAFTSSHKLSPTLSLDTFSLKVAKKALRANFRIINDISASIQLAEFALKEGAQYVLMHSCAAYLPALLAGKRLAAMPPQNRSGKKSTPKSQRSASEEALDILYEIDEFFEKRLDKLAALGCDVSQIILDPGIGFAKSPEQNLAIISNMAHFRHFGLKLLEGSSAKKSLGPPLVAPYLAANSKADIVRIHDAKSAQILINLKERLNNANT